MQESQGAPPAGLTLYVNRLPERINLELLKSLLYDLFVPFGQIVDIVAQKSLKKKGQAFIVFTEQRAASNAKTALQGKLFLNNPINIDFARSISRASELQYKCFVPRPPRKLRQPVGAPMSLALSGQPSSVS
jgi:U2 small nuclear ribonucleoprotein B''